MNLVGFLGGVARSWTHASKVAKVWHSPWCEICTKCIVFLGLCTYYQIWIPKYAIITGPLFWIMWKDTNLQWRTEETNAIAILKGAHCNIPTVRTLAVSESAGQNIAQLMPAWKGGGQSYHGKSIILTGTHVAMKVGIWTMPRRDMMWGDVSAVDW